MIFAVYDIGERIDFNPRFGGQRGHPHIRFKKGRPIPFGRVARRLDDQFLTADDFIFKLGVCQTVWAAMRAGMVGDLMAAGDDRLGCAFKSVDI